MPGRVLIKLIWYNKEAIIWITALVFLAVSSPDHHHYTLCPISNLGFSFCPGCGLGHSITNIFHGNFSASFQAHPLGFAALILITYRIVTLIRSFFINQFNIKIQNQHYGRIV